MINAFALALGAYLVLDFIWLRLMVSRLYLPEIGGLMRAAPDWRARLAFYAVYAFCMTQLVIIPAAAAGYPERALMNGAILGLAAYATFNLSNLATLRGWSNKFALANIIWGMIASACTSWLAAKFILDLAVPDGA